MENEKKKAEQEKLEKMSNANEYYQGLNSKPKNKRNILGSGKRDKSADILKAFSMNNLQPATNWHNTSEGMLDLMQNAHNAEY